MYAKITLLAAKGGYTCTPLTPLNLPLMTEMKPKPYNDTTLTDVYYLLTSRLVS